MNNQSIFLKGGLATLVVLLLFFEDYFQPLASYFHPEGIKVVLEKAGSASPFFCLILMALSVLFPFLPSLILDIAAGAFFGPVLGTLYCAVGALAGAVAAFLISRHYGRKFIARLLTGHINFWSECSDSLLTIIIFTSRLLPIVSFRLVSYGAGLTKMSVSAYSLATLAGMLPITFAYNYFGASILSASPGTVMLLGALMVLSFFLLPILVERFDLFYLRKYSNTKTEVIWGMVDFKLIGGNRKRSEVVLRPVQFDFPKTSKRVRT